MKRILSALLVLLLFSSWATAQERTVDEARLVAQSFACESLGVAPARGGDGAVQPSLAGTTAGCYLFNLAQDCGWVIVSRNSGACPVLAYSSEGSLDSLQLPCNMRAWIEEYDHQQAWMAQEEGQDGDEPAYTWPDISPMLTTQWGQKAPYNMMLPMICNNDNPDGWLPAVTGCVCTAICQVLYYHRWPETTLKPITYDVPDTLKEILARQYSFELEELPVTSFDWDKMKNEYTEDDTSDSAWEVAKLMRYVGQAVPIAYGPSGSNGYFRESTLTDYFGFSDSLRLVRDFLFNHDEWEATVYEELSEGRPVLTTASSHSFVCDGYQGDGFFHFNWGWNGWGNGYYKTSAMVITHPDGRCYDYGRFHEILIGVRPQKNTDSMSEHLANETDDTKRALYNLKGHRLASSGSRGLNIQHGRKFVKHP